MSGDEKLRSQLFNNSQGLLNKASELIENLDKYIRFGLLDQCVLPTSNSMDFEPESATLVAFDLVKSKSLKDSVREKILDEARRVGFQREAWEVTDEGDSLILLFADHEDNPKISHGTRALEAAIEIISRITYKFPLSKQDYDEDGSGSRSRFQQLRLVINSWKITEGRIYLAIADLKGLLDTNARKCQNSIFLMGDDILEILEGNRSLYKTVFLKALEIHKGRKTGVDKTVYWCDPIGWETLFLHMEGSPFLTRAGRRNRYHRYPVPGLLEVVVSRKVNKKDFVFNAQLYDIGQRGMRLRLSSDQIEEAKKILKKDVAIDISCPSKSEACVNLKGKVSYLITNDIILLGFKANRYIKLKEIRAFLESITL